MPRVLALLGGASLLALAYPSAFERASEAPAPETPLEAAPAVIDVSAPEERDDQSPKRSTTAGPTSGDTPRR